LYIVSPLLYQARQDRRNGKNESLDMSIELNNQKDRAHKLEGIIAVDVHNPAAFENSLTDYDCINLFPTVPMLKQLIKDIPNQLTNILVI
jgi:phosphoribosylpyrophosphate synthetase